MKGNDFLTVGTGFIELEVVSEPYVILTFKGYAPAIDVIVNPSKLEKAFFISGRYLPLMESIFRKKGLPIELTRIVFVESSFNIQAQSRVGASGLWQIMPIIGKKFKYLDANHDLRNDPRSATLWPFRDRYRRKAAAH